METSDKPNIKNDAISCFIMLTGQEDNLGDVMHRRVLLGWVRPVCRLHLFVGNLPADFIDALKTSSEDKLYTSLTDWVIALFRSPKAKTVFFFTSGEMSMSRKRLFLEALLFPLLRVIRLRGGSVFRVGVAISSARPSSVGAVWRRLLGESDQIYWRDTYSARVSRRGIVIPDLAFAERSPMYSPAPIRGRLVLSMRYDRPYLAANCLAAIKEFAFQHSLAIVTVAQVRRDSALAKQLAIDLGADYIGWPKDRPHSVQESILSSLYRRSDIAVSDRLHVLIAGLNHGAMPACLLTKDSKKVPLHLSELGLRSTMLVTRETRTASITTFLNSCIQQRTELCRETDKAHRKLISYSEQLRGFIKERHLTDDQMPDPGKLD